MSNMASLAERFTGDTRGVFSNESASLPTTNVFTLQQIVDQVLDGNFADFGLGYQVPRKLVNNSLRVPTAFRCIEIISDHIGSLPMSVHRPAEGSMVGMVSDPEHPLSMMFGESGEPFPEWTRFELIKWCSASLLLYGNAFLRVHRMGGKVAGVQPLEYHRVFVKYDEMTDGIRYEYAPGYVRGDVQQPNDFIAPEDIIHLRGLRLDTDVPWGVSVLTFAQKRLEAALVGNALSDSMWKNYNRPSFFLTMDEHLDDGEYERLVEQFQEQAGKAGHVGLLEYGLKPHALSMNPEEAQFLDSRKYNSAEIARMFGVPPFMLGETEKSTSWGTGLEEQYRGFVRTTLLPWMCTIQSGLTRKLLHHGAMMPGREVLRFDTSPLTDADSSRKMEYLTKALQWTIITPNEAREELGLAPREGGDEALTPPNAPKEEPSEDDMKRVAPPPDDEDKGKRRD